MDLPEKVKLKNLETGGVETYDRTHAARILAYDKKYGFKNFDLHDPKLTFQNGKIRAKPDTTDTKGKEVQPGPSGSD